jgi:riboflavin kinase/FMN adenylyltransferase
MKVVNGISNFTPPGIPVALTLGFFDGVHRGHQQLLTTLLAVARDAGAAPVILTFDSHPFRVVRPDRLPPMIMTLTQRLEIIAAMGIAHAIVQPFDEAFANISADAFIHELLVNTIQARIIVCGYDTHFGRDRAGTHAMLAALAPSAGYTCFDVPPLRDGTDVISSTAIRRAIGAGDLTTAREYLGRPWSIWAHVVEGRRLGRTLGFPTANLDTGYLVLPEPGIYAAYAHLRDKTYRGAMYIGMRPTVTAAPSVPSCEVYIMDVSGDLYDEWILVEPVQRLRGDRRFDTLDELSAQIRRDVDHAMALLRTDYVSPAVIPRHFDEVDRRRRSGTR